MKKCLNQVRIIGKVYGFGDANGRQALELKTSGPNAKKPGTEFIGGILQVAVDDAGLNVIPVHFTYVTATTSNGKANASFGVLKKILEEGKTWVSNGPEAATIVKIDGAVAVNDFYNNENEVVSAKQIEGSFVTVLSNASYEAEKAKKEKELNIFRADMLITSVKRTEKDPDNNINDDFVTVHGAVFNFRNELLPVDFIVRNESGMAYFEDLDASSVNPVFTKVWGEINCLTKVTEIREESAFGGDSVRTFERKTREYLIKGCASLPYEFDSEGIITRQELTEALQNREVHLADVKKNAEEYKNSKAGSAKASTPAAAPKTGSFNF